MTLSGASDSKLVGVDDYTSVHANPAFLRYRLEVMTKILRNEDIFITEGWGLDSLVFLRIADEVITARNSLIYRNAVNVNFGDFFPVKMERRQGDHQSYLHIFLRYMERLEVRWAGYGAGQFNVDAKKKVAEALSQFTKRKKEHLSGAMLSEIMYRVLSDHKIGVDEVTRTKIARGLENVANYFLEHENYTLKDTAPDKNVFKDNIKQLLHFGARQQGDQATTEKILRPLNEFVLQVELDDIDLGSSSPIMTLAEQELPEELQKVIFYLVNYSYLQVCANGYFNEQSKKPGQFTPLTISTPPVGSANLRYENFALDVIDKLSVVQDNRQKNYNELSRAKMFFDSESYYQQKLDKQLTVGGVKWDELWKNVLFLSQMREWKSLIKKLKNEEGKLDKKSDANLRKIYDQLNKMLVRNGCSEIVLTYGKSDSLRNMVNNLKFVSNDFNFELILGGSSVILSTLAGAVLGHELAKVISPNDSSVAALSAGAIGSVLGGINHLNIAKISSRNMCSILER